MQDQLDIFIDQFYGKYSPDDIPQGERRARLKEKLKGDFDGYVGQMYSKYAPDNLPDSTRLASLRSKYLVDNQSQEGGAIAGIKDMIQAAQEPAEGPQQPNTFVNAIERGVNLGKQADILNPAGGIPGSQGAEQLAQLQTESQSLPSTDSYQRFNSASTFGEALSELVRDPVRIIGQLTAESLSAMVYHGAPIVGERALQGGAFGAAAGSVIPVIGTEAGLTGGIGSGVVEGMAETSLNLEYAGKFLEVFKELGVDITNPEELKRAFQNDEFISEARTKALQKSIPIAIFDLISGGVAGRIVSKPAKSIIGKIGAGALELGVQGLLGGTGEAAGEVVSGEELQPGAILGEAIGEFGTSPVEVASGALTLNKNLEREVENSVNADKEIQTGDVTVDHAIDSEYQDIVQQLDAIEFEPLFEDNKTPINEENDLLTEDLTEEEAAAIQASTLPSRNEQEINLDDAEGPFMSELPSNPDFQTSLNDENELPNDLELTPEQAGALQATVLPSQSDQEINLDDSEQTPSIENAKRTREQAQAPSQKKEVKGEESKRVRVRSTPENRVETPKGIVEKIKSPEEIEQERQDKIIKYEKQLENIKRDKPNKQIKRLEILNEHTLGLPEVNEKVRSQQEKLKAVGNEKEFAKQIKTATPEDRLSIIALRATPQDKSNIDILRQFSTPAKDESQAFEEFNVFQDAYDTVSKSKDLLSTEVAELKNLYNKVKKEYDKVLAPKREAEKKAIEAKRATMRGKEKEKDDYIIAVAKALELKNPVSIKESVEAYNKWRKDSGLSELTPDRIKQIAGAEFYKKQAHTKIQGEARDREAQERRVLEQKREAEKKAKDQEATKNIKKQLGLSDDSEVKPLDPAGWNDIEADNDEETPVSEETKKELPSDIQDYVTGVEKASLKDLFSRIQKLYKSPKFLGALINLSELAEKIANRFSKNGIEVYLVDNMSIAKGVYINDMENNRQVIIVNKNLLANTDSHELVHFIVKNIVNSIAVTKYGIEQGKGKSINRYGSDSSGKLLAAIGNFYRKIDEIHEGALSKYRDTLVRIERKFKSGSPLSQQDKNFLIALSSYISSNGIEGFELISKSSQIRNLLDNTFDALNKKLVYGLKDSDEMLAETFSSPSFMTVMSQLEAPESFSKASKAASYFRIIVDALKDMLEQLTKSLGIDLKPLKNSYLEQLVDYVSEMENKYLIPDEVTALDGEVPDEQIYSNAANLLKESSMLYMAAGPTLNKMTPALKKLINYIANSWWKRESLQSLESVLREVEKINKKSKKNKLGDSDAMLIWQKMQKYRQQLADAKVIQGNSLDYAQAYLDEYQTSKSFKRTVDDFADVDLDRLSIGRVKEFEQGMLDLVTGSVPSNRAYNIVNMDKAQKKVEALLPTAGQYMTNPNILGFPVSKMANQATFSTVLSKYNTEVSQTFFDTIFGNLLESVTNAEVESNDFLSDVQDIINKRNLSHSDFANVAMYGAAFSTTLPPTHPEYWDEVTENLAWIVENAKNKISAIKEKLHDGNATRADKELEIAQDLQRRIGRVRDMNGILTTRQQELYDAIRTFTSTHEEDLKRNTKGVWGDHTSVWQNNYFPTFALGRVRRGTKGDDSIIPNARNSNNLWEGMQKDKSYGKIISHQSGFTKRRVKPEGYFYDYDAWSIAHKFAPATLFDLYASRELKSLNLLINGNQNVPASIDGNNIDSILPAKAVNAINKQIKSIVGSTIISDAEIAKWVKPFLAIRNNVAVAALATGGQFLVQASSAFPASIIMSPTGFPKALKILTGFEQGVGNFTVLRDFIKENGLSIQLRDALFERWQTIEDVQKEGLHRFNGNWKAWNERIATSALRRGDKFAARLVWFSEYFAAGGTLENPSRDAVLAAERAVGLLQNMSNVRFSAPIFRSNNVAERILMQMLMSFKSFALNSAINTWYSGRYFFNSGEARQVFFANMAMAGAYHLVKDYLVAPTYNWAADALFGEGDDDDDEKNFSKFDATLANWGWDLAVGQGTPQVIDATLRLGISQYLKRQAAKEGDTFDTYKDFPLYAPRTKNEVIQDFAGPWGTATTSLMDLSVFGYESMEALMDNDSEITSQQLMIDGLRNVAMLGRWMPLRGDAQKLLKAYDKKLKAEARQKGSGGDPENAGTEFELPEYDLDIPSDPTQVPEELQ